MSKSNCSQQRINHLPTDIPSTLNIPYLIVEVIIGIAAVIVNSFIIFLFFKDRKLRRSAANTYITSLAMADFFVGLVGIPTAILTSIGLPKNFYLCLPATTLLLLICTTSILSLVTVTLDRFIAVLYPFRYQRLNKRGWVKKVVVVVCWLIGSFIGSLPLMGWHLGKPNFKRCFFIEIIDPAYLTFLFWATIFSPSLVMAVAYARIYVEIRKQLDKDELSRHPSSIFSNSVTSSRRSSQQTHHHLQHQPLQKQQHKEQQNNHSQQQQQQKQQHFNQKQEQLPEHQLQSKPPLHQKNLLCKHESLHDFKHNSLENLPYSNLRQLDFLKKSVPSINVVDLNNNNNNGSNNHDTNNFKDNNNCMHSNLEKNLLHPSRICSKLSTNSTTIPHSQSDYSSKRHNVCEPTGHNINNIVPQHKQQNPEHYLQQKQHSRLLQQMQQQKFPQQHHVQQHPSFKFPPTNLSPDSPKSRWRSEFKIFRSLVLIVVSFMLSWLPLYMTNTIVWHCPCCQVPEDLLKTFICLSHLNSVWNPLIYAWGTKEYQRAFKKYVVEKWFGCLWDGYDLGNKKLGVKI